MSIGRCDWLLQEGQWIFGYLRFALSSRFSAILTFPLCVIHLWSPTHHHSLISSHLLQPSAFCNGLKNTFNCNCNVLQRLVFFFFLSCSSERWINATGVVPAQSLFTAGKEMHVWQISPARAPTYKNGPVSVPPTVTEPAGPARTSWLTWCWTAWRKVRIHPQAQF